MCLISRGDLGQVQEQRAGEFSGKARASVAPEENSLPARFFANSSAVCLASSRSGGGVLIPLPRKVDGLSGKLGAWLASSPCAP